MFIRRLLAVGAVIVLSLALMKMFGSITFAPWATNLLVDVTGALGIYGDEAVEDFYALATTVLSILLATAVVIVANRFLSRRGSTWKS